MSQKPMSVEEIQNTPQTNTVYDYALFVIRVNMLREEDGSPSQDYLRKAFTALLAVARGEYVRKQDVKDIIGEIQCDETGVTTVAQACVEMFDRIDALKGVE